VVAAADRWFGLALKLCADWLDTGSTFARLVDRFFSRRDQPADVRVRVRRARRMASSTADAYFVTVANTSPEEVTIRHVLFDAAGTMITLLTTPLPATVAPGQQWETWIDERELPPGFVDVEYSFLVILADDSLLASTPHEETPAAEPAPLLIDLPEAHSTGR